MDWFLSLVTTLVLVWLFNMVLANVILKLTSSVSSGVSSIRNRNIFNLEEKLQTYINNIGF